MFWALGEIHEQKGQGSAIVCLYSLGRDGGYGPALPTGETTSTAVYLNVKEIK